MIIFQTLKAPGRMIALFVVAIVIPMVYIIVASFIDPVTLQNKGITFDFSKWTLTAYERVLSNAQNNRFGL